jgi:hypothetical protein
MPATTTINAEQRRRLYELVRNDLGGIGDVTIALEKTTTSPPPSDSAAGSPRI